MKNWLLFISLIGLALVISVGPTLAKDVASGQLIAQASAESIAGKWMLVPNPETRSKGLIKEILKLELSGTKQVKGTAKRSDGAAFGDVKGTVEKGTVKLEIKLAGKSAGGSNDDKNKIKLDGKIEGNAVTLSDKEGGKYLMQKEPEKNGTAVH